MFAEIIGVGAYSVIILPDPEANIAISAMESIYAGYCKKYNSNLSKTDFIKNTQNLVGELTDLEFMSEYPHKICKWFSQC